MREVLFWLLVLSCAVGQALILRSWSRARARVDRGATPAGVPAPRALAEFAWTALPAIALAVMLAFTWRALHP